MAPEIVGLLPAAGRGLRFGGSGYAKELFPLLFEGAAGTEADRLEPRPICELALRAMAAAGACRCVTVVSPEKADVLRVLGRGFDTQMPLAYVVQPEPHGLPDALRCARPWLGDASVVFAMPDTVFFPESALAEVQARRIETSADVMLGVFPVDEPERLGPVDLGPDGAVRRIHDKPGPTAHRNTWGAAAWSPRFTDFCCAWDEARERDGGEERALGHAFEAARASKLVVGALHFPQGAFFDIGTPRGLRSALAALASRGVLQADQAATVRSGR